MRRFIGLGLVLVSCGVVACSSDGSSGQPTTTNGSGGSGGAQAGTGGTGGASGGGATGGSGGATGGSGGASGGGASGASGTGGNSGDGSGARDAEAVPESGRDANGSNPLDGSQRADATGGAGGTGGTTEAGTGDGSAPAADAASDGATRPARVLLYTLGSSGVISGVPAQIAILKQKLEGWQYTVDESKEPTAFTDANLAKYAAVGMINTCFYPFGDNQPGTTQSQALQKFLQAGGGLFGTHCAAVTFTSTTPPPLYNQLLGGRSGAGASEGATTCTKSGDHPTIAMLPETFPYTGNLDKNDFLKSDTTVLVKCKAQKTTDADIPVSWVRNEGAGRVFFTSFAKVDADLTNATIGDKHIIAGLGWVLGR
jgi:type 1 glutamine amidotransferase